MALRRTSNEDGRRRHSGQSQHSSTGHAHHAPHPPKRAVPRPTNSEELASAPDGPKATPGAPDSVVQYSERVRMAAMRFKGESSAKMSPHGMASLVDAALEHKRVMDRVREGLEAAKEEERATGDVLFGDENTHTQELLRERQAAVGRRRQPGMGKAARCHLSARYAVGNVVTHAACRYGIIALILLDMLLFLLEINGVVDSDSHSWLHVMEVVLVWIYAAEVMMKLFAFHKEFFHSWWNIFDFVIVGVTVVLLVLGTSMEGVLVGRSLKLFSVANRSLRVLRIVIKVYSQGSSMSRKQQVMSHAYPIEQVVAILHKVRFSSDLSRQERQQISFLINSLMANTLFIPNLDAITKDLELDSQVPDWIASNFNSKPKRVEMARKLGDSPAPSSRLRRRVPSYLGLKTASEEHDLPSAHLEQSVNIARVADMLESDLDTWSFDIFEFDRVTGGWPLFHCFLAIMQWHGLAEEANAPESTFASLIKCIEGQYHRENSYHSSVHGADVLQTVHVLLTTGHAGQRLQPIQRLSLLLASAAHDVAHPGLSNNFLVATGATEALLRNDESVLENMHAYTLFKALRRPSCNVYMNVAQDVYKEQRRSIIRCILATDLAKHFEIVGQFKSHTTSVSAGEDVPDWTLSQMILMLKMADISHPTKPWLAHSQWTQRCMIEFYTQGDMEKRLGLPVSPLMDRESTNIPSAQIGFVKVLVAPLFNAWAEANITLGWSDETDDASEDDAAAIMYSRADGEQCVRAGLQVLHEIDENLTDNLATWEKIKSGEVEWNADVSDANKWNEMSKRLDHELRPGVYNTSKYINLSGISSGNVPVRVFKTLDGAAALQSPKISAIVSNGSSPLASDASISQRIKSTRVAPASVPEESGEGEAKSGSGRDSALTGAGDTKATPPGQFIVSMSSPEARQVRHPSPSQSTRASGSASDQERKMDATVAVRVPGQLGL